MATSGDFSMATDSPASGASMQGLHGTGLLDLPGLAKKHV